MFCTTCAAPIPSGHPQCPKCGTPDTLRRATAARSPRRDTSRVLGGLLVVPVMVVALVAAGILGRIAIDHRSAAAAYRLGVGAEANGDLLTASRSFERAGGYRDASSRVSSLERRLAPYRDDYEAASRAIDRGEFDVAIALLLPIARDLPDFGDTLSLLEQARAGAEADLRSAAQSAVDAGDSIAAESLLAAIHVIDPEDDRITEQLRTLQGDQALFTFAWSQDLYLASPSSAKPRLLLDSVPVTWPVWSPDRTTIAFISPTSGSTGTRSALYVVAIDGTGLRKLADDPAQWRPPVWSPNGTEIAFDVDGQTLENQSARATVMVADLKTGEVRDVVDPSLPNGSSPVWSPTGDRLAFVVRAITRVQTDFPAPDEVLRVDASDVYVLNMESGTTEQIARGSVPEPWRLTWSPTSEDILVYCRADGTSFEQGAIYLLNATTGASRLIDKTNVNIAMPVWAPDGQRFAYVMRGVWVQIVGPGDLVSTVASDLLMSGFITWAPSGDRLLVSGESSSGKGVMIDTTAAVPAPEIVSISYDDGGGDSGPVQWSALNPDVPARSSSTSGTALDATNLD